MGACAAAGYGRRGSWPLWVKQAFGLLLLPGPGASISGPQVPWHPTSMCNSGINVLYKLTCM